MNPLSASPIVGRRIFERPKFGDKVGELNATIIHYTHVSDAGDGFYAHGIALCHHVHGIGEYVTWQVVFNHDRGEYICHRGDYPASFKGAMESYKERTNGR